MSKKQNPYHLWLGLPAELVSPNFFQLLDIAPDATDDKQISASARARAQQLLDLLKNVPVKSESEKAIRAKLKSRVVTAHKTISDPIKRKQYAHALATKNAGASSTSGIVPPASSPVPAPPASTSPPPTAPPANLPENIPQAIPLAMPIDSAPQPANTASANDDMFSGIGDEDTVRVRPVRARGKRSSIIPIVVTLLVISVIGGLVSLLAKYNNVFDVLAKREQAAATAPDPNAPAIPSLETITADPDTVAAPEAAPPEPLQVPESFDAIAEAQNRRTKSASGKTNAAVGTSSENGMADRAADGNNTATKTPTPDKAPKLSAVEMAATTSVARVASNMVRSALVRRDVPAAKIANTRVKRLAGAEFFDTRTRSLLEKEHAQNQQMITSLEVFLAQLHSAADELPGGQDIKIDALIMALVDSSPTAVTLRRAGRNEVIPYTDLPTSVAIALGDQGSKKSVPQWNMAKAADLVIQSQYNPTLLEKAQPFLTQSTSDGYDKECQAISAFSDTAWQQQHLPKSRPADPNVAEASVQLKDFRAASGYKNPKLVKADVASELLEKLLYSPASQPKERMARLSDAIAVAATHKNFDALLAATGELYKLSNPVNVAGTLVSPINRCMRADMTAAEARHLVHTIIGLTKQLEGRQWYEEKAKPKLLSHAQTLVEEFEFSELAPKVKQLTN